LDNLNTHLCTSFEEVLGVKTAATILRKIEFHYTPNHASWLNMAEIEIGILQRQCLARCAADQTTLATEVTAWQRRRNAARCGIEWTFTRRDGDRKLSRHYASQFQLRFESEREGHVHVLSTEPRASDTGGAVGRGRYVPPPGREKKSKSGGMLGSTVDGMEELFLCLVEFFSGFIVADGCGDLIQILEGDSRFEEATGLGE
jgi:hypothetical protein